MVDTALAPSKPAPPIPEGLNRVSALNGKYPGSDIYVVGTGTSLRVFPLDFFEDKITIGLNMIWKVLPTTYAITIRPEINIPEFMPEYCDKTGNTSEYRPEFASITWVTKFNKLTTDEQRQFVRDHSERFYFYQTESGRPNTAPPGEATTVGRVLDWVREPVGDYLYLWSSISQSAVNLAANMGAKNIILVGCDNASIGGNHHAHAQHTWWKGVDPNFRYHEYYEGLAEMRTVLRERGVRLLSLTPFLGLGNPDEDFALQCRELGVEEFIANPDVSHVYAKPGKSGGVRGWFNKLKPFRR